MGNPQLHKYGSVTTSMGLVEASVIVCRLPTAPKKLQTGIPGLGDSARYSINYLSRTLRAEMSAAGTPDANEIPWVKKHHEPQGVTLWKSYAEMLELEGLRVVLVAFVITVHAKQAIEAIEANKHVPCERPFSTIVEDVSILST